MLENSAASFPDKVAVKEGEKFLSYSRLCSRSRVFGTAIAAFNVKNQPVGVFLEKGIDALCSFMGIVYAGGFYSMLNTELPDSRLRGIVSVLEPKIIITVRTNLRYFLSMKNSRILLMLFLRKQR